MNLVNLPRIRRNVGRDHNKVGYAVADSMSPTSLRLESWKSILNCKEESRADGYVTDSWMGSVSARGVSVLMA